MDNTPNLQLPYLIAAQAQKHVTHNEALRALDAIVQLLVLDKDLASPPGSPTDGSRYIVAASPTGAWSGQAGKVAAWQDGAWVFYTPREGWLAWVADEDKVYFYSGSAWALLVSAGALHAVVEDTAPQLGGDLDANGHNLGFDSSTGITDDSGNEQLLFHKTASAVNQVGITNAATGNAPLLAAEGGDTNIDLKLRGKGTGQIDVDKVGINATADTTNRLAVKSPASLLDNVGNGHQQKINKAAAGDTASTLYQTGYSGRAELGLTGDDNFHVKVSPNGSSWKEAMVVDKSTGFVGFGTTVPGFQTHVVGDGVSPVALIESYGTSVAPNLIMRGARGSAASPTASQTNDTLFILQGRGYGATGFAATSRLAVRGFAAEAWSDSAQGTYLDFLTTPIGGTTIATRLRVKDDGKIGIGTTAPADKLSVEGIISPQTDNAYTCGTASKRWSDVYAVSGTVNTSDARLKASIEDSRLGLAFILNCRPRSYRWLEGGVTVEWDDETYEVQEPLTEERAVVVPVIEMRDGVAMERLIERTVSVPVVDQVPVVDEAGHPVMVDGAPKMHAVQRMRTLTETRQVKREVKRAGARMHYGLVAQEVQVALSQAGVSDFAGWVLADKDDPNSTQGLRYDQFIAPLIKAVQELSARVETLEAQRAAS